MNEISDAIRQVAAEKRKEKISPEQSTARGHMCCVNRFDEATVTIPFNEKEIDRLLKGMKDRIAKLQTTGDYPEQAEDLNTVHNLLTAYWMLTRK